MLTGQSTLLEVSYNLNRLPSIVLGKPPPLLKLTIPPAVDPLVDQLLVPLFQLTVKFKALLSPIAFLDRTAQKPEGTAVVTSKSIDSFSAAEAGRTMVQSVQQSVRLTYTNEFQSKKFQPVSVIVSTDVSDIEAEDDDISVSVGESVQFIYEKLQLPGQLLRINNLVDTTTLTGSYSSYTLLILGVLHKIWVAVMFYILQNQFRVHPTQTKVCCSSVEKFYPVIVKRVPP